MKTDETTLSYQCIKTLVMENGEEVAFTEGKLYKPVSKDAIWPPDPNCRYGLVDDLGRNHFFTEGFYEHFKIL